MKLIIDIPDKVKTYLDQTTTCDGEDYYVQHFSLWIAEAIKNGKPYDNYGYIEGYKQTKLKTVRPPQYWLWDDTGHFYCPQCKKYPDYQIRLMNFCPNCSCDLRGEI